MDPDELKENLPIGVTRIDLTDGWLTRLKDIEIPAEVTHVLVLWGGHGVEVASQWRLVLEQPNRDRIQFIDVSRAVSMFRSISRAGEDPYGHKLTILVDACREIQPDNYGGLTWVSDNLGALNPQTTDVCIVSSAALGQLADDEESFSNFFCNEVTVLCEKVEEALEWMSDDKLAVLIEKFQFTNSDGQRPVLVTADQIGLVDRWVRPIEDYAIRVVVKESLKDRGQLDGYWCRYISGRETRATPFTVPAEKDLRGEMNRVLKEAYFLGSVRLPFRWELTLDATKLFECVTEWVYDEEDDVERALSHARYVVRSYERFRKNDSEALENLKKAKCSNQEVRSFRRNHDASDLKYIFFQSYLVLLETPDKEFELKVARNLSRHGTLHALWIIGDDDLSDAHEQGMNAAGLVQKFSPYDFRTDISTTKHNCPVMAQHRMKLVVYHDDPDSDLQYFSSTEKNNLNTRAINE